MIAGLPGRTAPATFHHSRPSSSLVAPGRRLGCARTRGGRAFHDQERPERAERESAALLAIPNRAKLALQAIVSKLKKHHQVGTFAIVSAAQQRDVALSRPDACERDTHRVDAGQLLAHEG